jgi:hypothetical protein
MVYLKSFCVGTLAAFVGAFVFLVRMFLLGLRTSRNVGIDIATLQSPIFMILVVRLFVIGLLFEFKRLKRGF